MNSTQLLVVLTAVFSLIMIYTSITALKRKKYNYLIEDIVTYAFYITFLIAQYIIKFQVRIFIIFLVLISFVGNSLIGKCLNVYNTSKHYDRFLHAFGVFSFSLFSYSILSKITAYSIYPKVYGCIFVSTIGISLGCMLEIYEFITDSITKSYNQHGLTDTNFDLISDVIGSVIAGIISYFILL